MAKRTAVKSSRGANFEGILREHTVEVESVKLDASAYYDTQTDVYLDGEKIGHVSFRKDPRNEVEWSASTAGYYTTGLGRYSKQTTRNQMVHLLVNTVLRNRARAAA